MDALHPENKEHVEQIAAYYVANGYFRRFLRSGYNGCGKFWQDVPPATSVSPITDSLTPRLRARPLAPSTKQLLLGNKCSKPAQNVEDRLPKWQLPDSFLTAGCFFGPCEAMAKV